MDGWIEGGGKRNEEVKSGQNGERGRAEERAKPRGERGPNQAAKDSAWSERGGEISHRR